MVVKFPLSRSARDPSATFDRELLAQRIRYLITEPSVAAIIRNRRVSSRRRALAVAQRVRELCDAPG